MLTAFEIFSCFLAVIYSGIWVPEFFTATEERIEPWSFLTISTLSGLLTVYIGFLVLGDFQKVFYACHVIGLVSALWLIFKAQKGKLKPQTLPFTAGHWVLLGLALLILFAVFFTGITDWQARSVWYFQAKILHHTGSLNGPEWHNPIYSFVSTASPKLYPVVIAFVTSNWRDWNEYVPKWTLFLFLLPLVTSLFSQKLRPSTLILIFLALLGIPEESLWNGSPEAYAAAFFALGLLNYAQYQKTHEKTHMLQAFLFLGIIPSLVENGLAAVVCFALALSFFGRAAGAILQERNVSKFLIIPAGAFVFWQLRKLEFHHAESLMPSREMFGVMITRVKEIKPFFLIVRNTILANIQMLAYFALITIYFHISKIREVEDNRMRWWRPDLQWVIIAGGLYLVFLFLVYWAAPANIQWYATAYLRDAALNVKFAAIIYVALCLEPRIASDSDEVARDRVTFAVSKAE